MLNDETSIIDSLAFGAGKESGEQQTLEWLMQRVGKVTASRFADVQDFNKTGKPSAKRTTYLWDVIVERITGKPTERYVNAAMEWGTMYEGQARMAYEAATGAMVVESGFRNHSTIHMCGGSVDGLVNDDGIIEIKAPTSSTHLKTWLCNDCEYQSQIQGYLWITGRQWADYVSYDPRMPETLALYVKRYERDDVFIAKLETDVLAFLAEVAEIHNEIQKKIIGYP